MTDYTNLIRRLRAAAEDMQRGVHTPGHIALIKEAAQALYDLTHPKNWTLLPDKEPTNAEVKN